MNRFQRSVAMAAVAVVAASLLVVAAWQMLAAWVAGLPWLMPLWINVSYILHREWFVVPLVALIYIAGFVFARWHLIAWPSRRELLQRIGDVRLQLRMEASGGPEKERKIGELLAMLDHSAARVNRIAFLDRILWSRGQEQANTRHVSEVERELAILQPSPRVKAHLETAEQQLREISTKDAGALADVIHLQLAASPDAERIRCLLYEALGVVYANRDDENDTLLTWHNKTLWLTGLGILLLISLEGVKRGGGGLFVVGAAGGFMSRLMRTLKRDNVPTDYGAYWTTLFLSPLVGALAGWTGILLIEMAHTLGLLGEFFKVVTLQSGYGDFTLGLAFLLGFSERLFDEILKPLEASIEKKVQATSSTPSGSSSGSANSGGSSGSGGSPSGSSGSGPSAGAGSSSSAGPSSSGSGSSGSSAGSGASAGAGSSSSAGPSSSGSGSSGSSAGSGASASGAGSSSSAGPSSSGRGSSSSSAGSGASAGAGSSSSAGPSSSGSGSSGSSAGSGSSSSPSARPGAPAAGAGSSSSSAGSGSSSSASSRSGASASGAGSSSVAGSSSISRGSSSSSGRI